MPKGTNTRNLSVFLNQQMFAENIKIEKNKEPINGQRLYRYSCVLKVI